jgi:hypothetical protein
MYLKPNTVHLENQHLAEDASRRTAIAWPQVIVAHLALDTPGVYSVAAGTDPLLEDLIQHGFMKGFPVLRGE